MANQPQNGARKRAGQIIWLGWIIVAVRNSVRPNHLFDPNRDHDYYFETGLRRQRSDEFKPKTVSATLANNSQHPKATRNPELNFQ